MAITDQQQKQPSFDVSTLSNREREVLTLLCKGASRADIAKQLYRSPKTIDNHCTRIYNKLGVQSQAQLVSMSYESGLIRPSSGKTGTQHPDRRVFDAFMKIEKRLAPAAPDRLFAELVTALSEVLDTEIAGVSEFDSESGDIVIIVAIDRGKLTDQLTCSPDGSPCDQVHRVGECACASDARSVFPMSEALRVIGADSYAGVRLDARTLGPVGSLWVADRRPIEDIELVQSVLRLLAGRIACELGLQLTIDQLDELGHRSRLSPATWRNGQST